MKWSKISQNMSFDLMEWMGCVRYEKLQRDFVARTCAGLANLLPNNTPYPITKYITT
jgi:hypothetical protein